MFDAAFLDTCLARGAKAIRETLKKPPRVTHVAHGRARVAVG
jgi:hypothetical protein